MGVEATAKRDAAAMRSPVSWALLGLVIERPSYGYELMQRFERTYGDALELSSPSQIYVALDTLGRHNLIEELPIDTGASIGIRQPKPHYQATAAGLDSYQEWLIAQMRGERRRSRLFARQLAALEPRVALAVIERYEQACLHDESELPKAAVEEPSATAGLAARLANEEKRLAVGARLSWIDYARHELAALAAAPAPGR
jgi:DNA-binding PadR family transcriptional regulator